MHGIPVAFPSPQLKTQLKHGTLSSKPPLIVTRQYPFETQTDRLEFEVDSINKWTEDQLDLVEESIDEIETNLPNISANYSSNLATFNAIQSTAKQLSQRMISFNENTKGIHDTTMKLRYAYSSADGLKEKMASVESVMERISARMEKLSRRLDAVTKLRRRQKLERTYRIRWLIMTGISIFVGLALAFIHFR